MGKILIIIGILMVVAGLIFTYAPKLPFLGRLPGDIVIERGNFKMYVPVATSIVLSILISLVLFLINKSKQ